MSEGAAAVCRSTIEFLQTPIAPAEDADVNTSILLALTWLSTPILPSPAPPGTAGVVELRSGAWAVVHAGQLWVCWREGPDCFRRVEFDDDAGPRTDVELELELEPELDAADVRGEFLIDEFDAPLEFGPERWRLGFDSASHLWVEIDDRRYRIEAGHARARPSADATVVALARPRAFDCGPTGQRPAVLGGRLVWQSAPTCAVPSAGSTCVDTSVRPRPRKPAPVRLRAGFEIAVPRGWAAMDLDSESPTVAVVRPRAAFEISFVLELGFDPTRFADSRARAALLAHSRLRAVPTPRPGPLADAERRELLLAACGGDR